jgi:hypothetical protein
MIQRLQSLFLLIASASFFAQFLWPLASSSESGGVYLQDQIFDVQDHIMLTILTILGGAIALLSIFMFKKRKLQLKLGYLIIVAAILLTFLSIVLFMNDSAKLSEQVIIEDQMGLYLPIISLVAAFLANRYIKKDDKLVRSMDRLR